MNFYIYKIKDKNGNIIRGKIEAESQEKAVQYITASGDIILSISEEKIGHKVGKRRVKAEDLVVFSRQLTTLVKSGITLVEALDILQQQSTNKYFKSVILQMRASLESGASFSNTVAKYPNIFSELYVSMVEAAEASGNLPEILDRLAIYMEKTESLRRKVISSLTYPIVVISMAILITSFLVFKIIPTFKEIFAMLKGELPLPTRILIFISENLKRNLIYVLGIAFGGFIGFKKYISTKSGRIRFDRFLLKIPIIGEIVRKIAIAQFARTFSTLTRSGVPIITCLEIVGKTSGNKIIEEAIGEAKKAIQEGLPVSKPLEDSGMFPPLVTKMISVGEKTGRLEEMLAKIADFYEEQAEAVIANLTSILEPLVIAFLGVVIGGIVVSLFLPIIQITQLIGK